ncbi:MAG: SBBP repeat-containing protein, partial [Flavobacteriales bacterium]
MINKFKHRLFTLVVFFLALNSNFSQKFDWAKSISGTGFIRTIESTTDNVGNLYTTGSFEGTVDFDPGPGISNLTSNGGANVYVQKLNSSGNLVWAKSFGGRSLTNEGKSISVDSSGNVYTTGRFQGIADFDPGVGVSNLTSNGSTDIFVQKLNASGNFVWARSFGWTGSDNVSSISVDGSGNVYTSGSFGGTIDFDPGSGVSKLYSKGSFDIFIQKLNASGNLVWAKSFGGTSSDYGTSISVDGSGNAYTTGSFSGTVDFDPGSGVSNLTSNGSSDIFIQKLNASGNLVWAKSIGGTSSDQGTSISVDGSGNVYTTGHYQGTVDFDPGSGRNWLNSNGRDDVYVQKLNSSGNLVWARSFGGTGYDRGLSISVDGSGNIYTTGQFYVSVDFDPGSGSVRLTSNGSGDIFVQKLNSTGNYVWAKSFGGSSLDDVSSISVDGSGNVFTTGKVSGDIFAQKLNTLGYLVWAKSLVTNVASVYSTSNAVDGSGNVYTTGYFQGTVDFDPGIGLSNLTSNGGSDIFIQKLNASGNLVWAKSFGGTGDDGGASISIDGSGNAYTTGYFQGTADFDPGSGVVNLTSNNGSSDIYVQKLNSLGNLVWAKSFGGRNTDQGYSIAVDGIGNVYSTGRFTGSVDFDPGGSGSSNLNSYTLSHFYVKKLNSLGNFVWVKEIKEAGYVSKSSISVDGSGNVYTLGGFTGTVDFNPGSAVSNRTSNGRQDIFIQKLNSAGNYVWAKSFGGTGYDYGLSISVDGLGNIHTTGRFDGTVDFDPGGGVNNLTSSSSYSAYVQKLNTGGHLVWAKSMAGAGPSQGNSISVDGTGNVYTIGEYRGIIPFNIGLGTSSITSQGTEYDVYVQKLNAGGNLVWAKSLGGPQREYGAAISVNHQGDVYTTGRFQGTVDFDLGSGVSNLTSISTYDVFIQKLSNCIFTTGTDVQTACNSFTWIDGVTYRSSNSTATQTLTNATGCDSVVTLNLTINNSTRGTDVQTACDSYTWIDGVTYTSSNSTATQTLTNSSGCDSVVTLNLTINNSNTGTDVQTACDSYTWINGVTYTSSNNTATQTLTNAAGCDSIVTL